MTESSLALRTNRIESEQAQVGQIVVGKDVLELLSSAMYVDPLTIYREYLQNAADAIDDAHATGHYKNNEKGIVRISIDSSQRRVTISDNGIGLRWEDFGRRLTALGASAKRGSAARGFRGVGRLAGLGYAQRLTFRSRTQGEDEVSELSWDCRLLRSALRSNDIDIGVEDLIRRAVRLVKVPADRYPSHFFEVELDGVLRLRSDKLMSPTAIGEYLAQVAPVPFAPDFPFGSKIQSALEPVVKLDSLELQISELDGPIYRPHRAGFTDAKRRGTFEDVEVIAVPDVDGGLAAIGWLMHHEYDGAVPSGTGFKGLRLRVGNVQIGGNALLEDLFTEPRFNSWSIGELHILDKRIIPNARRDDFEQDAHYSNLLNQLAPTARAISKRCRTSSKRRQLLRDFKMQEQSARERLQILAQGGIRREAQKAQSIHIGNALDRMTRLAVAKELEGEKDKLEARIAKLQERVRSVIGTPSTSPLDLVAPHRRGMYGQMIELIYECSINRIAAKALVDRILQKIARENDTKSRPSPNAAKSKGRKTQTNSRASRRARKSKARSA